MWYRFDVLGHYKYNGVERTIESVFVQADTPLRAGRKLVDVADRSSAITDLDLPVPPRPLHRLAAFLLGLTKARSDIVIEAQR